MEPFTAMDLNIYDIKIYFITFFQSATATSEPGPPHHRGLTITLRHTTISVTPLDG